SHSRWAIEEGPWNFEPFGQMRRERFYAENFGGVMSTEQEIHPKFVGRYRRPMWRFAGDKGVDPLLRNLVDFRAGAAGNDPDCSSFLWTNMKAFTEPRSAFCNLRSSSSHGDETRAFTPIN